MKTFDWVDALWTAILLGLLFCFVRLAPRLKIDKSEPTDDQPRALSDQEIEDLENRGGIW
jgi:hypothetical protein